jgi:hypothetical protein
MKVITFPSAEHMPAILEQFKKENSALGEVIQSLQSVPTKNDPLSEIELKKQIDMLIEVSDSLTKIFEYSNERVEAEYKVIFDQLCDLTKSIKEVDSALRDNSYSAPFGESSLFSIKTSLHRCLSGDNLFNSMISLS